MHTLSDQFARHDHARAIRVSRAAAVEEIMCGLIGGEDDERLAAHAEMHDRAILLAPVVELQPLEALGELVNISNYRRRPGSWR